MKLLDRFIPPHQPQRPVLTIKSTPEECQKVWEHDLAESARQAAEARQKASDLWEQRRILRAQREADSPAVIGIGPTATTVQILYEIQPLRALHATICEVRAKLAENLHAKLQAAFDPQRAAMNIETIPRTD